MRSLPRALTLLPTWFALCSFVLPAGSALCIGSGGHVAVEPAAPAGMPCCDAPVESAGASACATESGAPCEDIRIDPGAALVSRPDLESGPAAVAVPCAAAVLSLPRISVRRPGAVVPGALRGTPVAHLIVQRR